mmetsp:Transcript_8818/g.29058  ORF Transcript_8818/g.29058 Transcript_8818/m.29058 type:complete len:293 (+) Transcript_8818:130-1008(+)
MQKDAAGAERASLVSASETSSEQAVSKSTKTALLLKWGSLAVLMVQNSSAFVVTRYTRQGKPNELYLTSVVVLMVELIKMAICLLLLLRDARGSVRELCAELQHHLWVERRTTLLLGVPALCYAMQNNLVFVAISNLSAAAAQVLYQLKTISTAFFTVLLLRRSFRAAQWVSFLLLMAGVALVQSEDGKSSSAPTGAAPWLGVSAALTAASISGFAGVFLEKMFTSGPRLGPEGDEARSRARLPYLDMGRCCGASRRRAVHRRGDQVCRKRPQDVCDGARSSAHLWLVDGPL